MKNKFQGYGVQLRQVQTKKGAQNKDWIQIKKHGKIIKIDIIVQKPDAKDKRKRSNIDVKPNIKSETEHEVIDKIYNKKIEKFLYYHWIQKFIQTNSKDPRPKSQDTKQLESITCINSSRQLAQA